MAEKYHEHSDSLAEKKRTEQELKDTQQKLENILNTIPGHVFWKDRNCILLGCNNLQAKNMSFASSKEMIGKSNYDVIHPNQPEELKKAQAEAITKIDLEIMSSGMTHTIEEPLVLPDGSTAIYFSKKTPLRNANDEIIGLLGISFDVTEQKQIELKLQETQQKLEHILNTIPGHVYWKNANGAFLGCNDLQAEDAGLAKEAMIGKTDYEMPWKDQADFLRQIDLQVMQTGASQVAEEPSTLTDGKEAIFLSKKTPLYHQGSIIGILGVSFDITEHKRIEQELQETRHKLDGMTLVSASIAHELRTPLASLSVGASALKNYLPRLLEAYRAAEQANIPLAKIPAKQLQLLEKLPTAMETETKGASTFIDMLLMNVKPALDSDTQKTFSIANCVAEALARYPFRQQQRASLEWQGQEDFLVNGNVLLATHILFNLIKNALYHMAKVNKGVISIWLETGKPYNKLFFKDTGSGIASAILPHIFDRFFSKIHHGAGIGLTFCKMVMESFNGKITCDSVEGNYTQFVLYFPAIEVL